VRETTYLTGVVARVFGAEIVGALTMMVGLCFGGTVENNNVGVNI
jgi:hypothetical protein